MCLTTALEQIRKTSKISSTYATSNEFSQGGHKQYQREGGQTDKNVFDLAEEGKLITPHQRGHYYLSFLPATKFVPVLDPLIFLSWHGTLQGTLTPPHVCCFQSYTIRRACAGHRIPWSPTRTTDPSLLQAPPPVPAL